ncbi:MULTISPECIES: large conductance mechanosensitive channel protein MscL [Anaerococcus]|jgi:large conductance mechanosensitive channel protein|uniref:large conductance mechanosensitive channel protein MscL n=1 Tax=Anaerococcus TaxID=165779 RepID=UPI002353943E|nr:MULTISPECIES: large conductance mechanosensitive channel protein MscL [Anaerococcus]MDU2598295.1 large conductance mechanosensitive channel protein MscL [Anaerococcus sp.]MDU4026686.1 large conductance mechanosensitive channel protein MscL [Anaerococcus sp.]MDU7412253.1 large conductance mechanosensitive channel protein MscL [Anaerococcus sp.]
MIQEFKDFIAKGNVLDMAVGIIMGTAFTAIVNSVVEDLLMPIITGLTAGVDFSDLYVTVGGAKLMFGNLINAIITFLIISFVMFAIVKTFNRHSDEASEEAPTKECPYCKSSIAVEATRCPHCTSELEGYHNEYAHAHNDRVTIVE